MHRHEDSKNRPSGETVAFNDAAMIPDDLGNQSKTEASPARFGRNEGIKKFRTRSVGTPGPLSLTQNSSGKATRACEPGTAMRTPGRNAVVSSISPSF